MDCHAAGLYVLNANKKCAICSYGITSAFDKTPLIIAALRAYASVPLST